MRARGAGVRLARGDAGAAQDELRQGGPHRQARAQVSRNDLILAQHLDDTEPADRPYVFCDVVDSGGEEAAAFAGSGVPVQVDHLELPKQEHVSSFIFSIDTCDGRVDAADVTPRAPDTGSTPGRPRR